MEQVLYVICPISNTMRYKSRVELFSKFKEMMLANKHVKLYTVEAILHERNFQITSNTNPCDVQIKIHDELWHKENLINIGISKLPPDAKYIAWIDGDVSFTNPNWALETIHRLQHNPVVQLFSHSIDLGPNHEHINSHLSFGFRWVTNGYDNPLLFKTDSFMKTNYSFHLSGHPGYAWAARREWIDCVGGLIDFNILGSADRQMAFGIVGHMKESIFDKANNNYIHKLLEWEKRALMYRRDIGYVPGTLIHYWHGNKKSRGYNNRWEVLKNNNYDPDLHIRYDSYGVIHLNNHADPHGVLRDQIRSYFRSRNEDSIDM